MVRPVFAYERPTFSVGVLRCAALCSVSSPPHIPSLAPMLKRGHSPAGTFSSLVSSDNGSYYDLSECGSDCDTGAAWTEGYSSIAGSQSCDVCASG